MSLFSILRRASSLTCRLKVRKLNTHLAAQPSIGDTEDLFNVSSLVSIEEMFNNRVHLGHHEGCWNPLTHPYIYAQRSTQHIIDLNQTKDCLKCALNVLSNIVYQRGIVLFASTNPRFDHDIQRAARDSGEYFITHGWQKGLFTNSHMKLGTQNLPDVVIAFNNSRFEKTRNIIYEAAMCNIPVIGIIDTDCDPRLITYPVPANDDTPDSVNHLCQTFTKAILNAKEKRDEKS